MLPISYIDNRNCGNACSLQNSFSSDILSESIYSPVEKLSLSFINENSDKQISLYLWLRFAIFLSLNSPLYFQYPDFPHLQYRQMIFEQSRSSPC